MSKEERSSPVAPVLGASDEGSPRAHSHELSRAIFDGALDAMLLANDDGAYVDANPEACRLFGLAREVLLGRTLAELAAPRYDAAGAHRLLLTRGRMRGRLPLLRADGPERIVDYSAVANVSPGLHLSVLRDVTEQVVAEEARRHSETLFRTLVEKGSDAISLTSADGTTRYLTPSAWRLLGFTLDEMGGRTMRDLVVPEDRPRIAAELDRIMHSGERDSTMEFRVNHHDGSVRWILCSATNLLDDPDVRAIVGNYRDITSRKQVEQALRMSEERYRRIVDNTSEGVWLSDDRYETTYVNQRLADMLGYTVAEMIGQPVFPFLTEEGQALAKAKFEQRKRTGAQETYQNSYRRKDGTVCWALAKTNVVHGEDGRFAGTVGLLTDMTEQRAAEATLRSTEEQFRQAQKMDAVGRLAGGIAHDFNNLLSVVMSYADLALEDLKPEDPLCVDLGEIRTAAVRATELTKQLLAFSRQQLLQPRVIELRRVVEDMERMLRRLLGEDIEMILRPSPDLGRVLADPGQIEQVVMNLAVNARDAMPSGGQLTVELTNVTKSVDGAPQDYVVLAITDTGTGMDEVTRARIFEPFFTTKPVGKGTGLGLATVFGIVQQSGGHIEVYSERGQGTRFEILLPRTERTSEARASAPTVLDLRGTETILLVEDEAQVRAVASTILRRSGYHVLDTSGAGEALLVSDEFAGEIHLLLTDVVMPRMGGGRLAERLSAKRPDMKVLFASGYNDDAVVRHGVEAGLAFLQKPFTADALLRKVREVLLADVARVDG